MSNKKTEHTVGEEEVEIDIDDGSIISEVELSDGGEELGEDDESIESAIPDDNENDEFEIEGYDADDGLDGEGKLELLNDNDTEYDDDISDDEIDQDLKKFENIEKQSYINNFHQNMVEHNEEEIKALSTVIRDKNNNVIDNLHKTVPILSKYEKSRILGIRASQINNGAQILVKPKIKTFDGYLIAQQELEERKIPFIIKRPLPMGGGCEYWKLNDLEIV
jgi:DNA-directed RNA polymerases I, II, and III subunit RPABC2